MDEVRYIISEASKAVGVADHVLRYWEDELKLPISRNEMQHRFYKDTDIELFKKIKELKEQGFQLKAIKMLLPDINKLDTLDTQSMVRLKDELNGKVNDMHDEENKTGNEEGTSLVASEKEHELKDQPNDKMSQFKAIMNNIILSALKENNMALSDEICMNVTDGVIKEMSFLMKLQEEREEERYKKFDATLRDYQKSRMLAAAAKEGKSKRKSRFFKKNNIHI